GTPMGMVMRRSWLPALQSSELPDPGGAPIHVELLGEDLVAFRDKEGNVGLLEELCCHRGASLSVGRVEEKGIRCIFHGWLFGREGEVLETPNVSDPRFKERFRHKSYEVKEAGGIIWAYMGDPVHRPAFPDFPFVSAPAKERMNALAVVPCNY